MSEARSRQGRSASAVDHRPRPSGAGSAGPASTRRRARIASAWLPPVLAAALMTALGLWGLARGGIMGNDEVATRWAALLPLGQLRHLLGHLDAVHGLYYLIIHAWAVFGRDPLVMRLPSMIAMVVAAALVAVLGRRLTGSGWAGLFAGVIMALTPVITYYAQTARSYAMVYACVVATTGVFVKALTAEAAGEELGRVARWWLLYAGLVTLGGYLNEMSLLVLAAHGVTVLLARYDRAILFTWARAAAGGAILVLPLMIVSALESNAVGWIPPPNLISIKMLAHDYLGGTWPVAAVVVVCILAALVPGRDGWPPFFATTAASDGAGAGPEAPWWRRGGLSLPSVALPLLVVPAGLLGIESVLAKPLYLDRYVLYGEVGAALLAGGGLYRIGRAVAAAVRRPGLARVALTVAPGIVMCACILLLQFGAQQRVRTPEIRQFDFGNPARYIAAHARPGDGILFFRDFFRKIELGYPEDFRKVSDFSVQVRPAQAGDFNGLSKPLTVVATLMPQYRRIWVVGRIPQVERPPGLFGQESVLLQRSYHMVDLQHYRGMSVTLWRHN